MPSIADLIYDKLMDNPYPEVFEASKAENPELGWYALDISDNKTAYIEFTYEGKFIRIIIEGV